MSEFQNRLRSIIRELEQMNSNTNHVNLNYYEHYYNNSDPYNNEYRTPSNERVLNTPSTAAADNIADITVNLYDNLTSDQGSTANSASAPEAHEPPNTNITGNTNNIRTTGNTVPLRNALSIASGNPNISGHIINSISSILGDIGPLNEALSIGANIYRVDNIFNTASENNQPQGLALSQLNEKTNVYIQDTANENDECHICREEYNDNSIYRKNISCGHYFHQGCIDTWYSEKNKCPICNQGL